jgi:hypothetical protein
LTHDLHLFRCVPLLSDYTDTFNITLPTLTAALNDPLLLLLGPLPLFDLLLRPLLFRLSSEGILSFEPVVDEEVTALLDVEGAA